MTAQSLPFDRKSQCELILQHLQNGGTLTVYEAMFDPFRCMALSQRCGELRRDGFNVQSEMITLPNKKRVARYFIPRDEAVGIRSSLKRIHFARSSEGW